MTPGQTRVLGLLGVLFALQAVVNPTFRQNLVAASTARSITAPMLGGFVGWMAGGVALVALAGPAPKISTYIVLIFMALALLEHPQQWASALGSASAAMTSFATTPAPPASGQGAHK